MSRKNESQLEKKISHFFSRLLTFGKTFIQAFVLVAIGFSIGPGALANSESEVGGLIKRKESFQRKEVFLQELREKTFRILCSGEKTFLRTCYFQNERSCRQFLTEPFNQIQRRVPIEVKSISIGKESKELAAQLDQNFDLLVWSRLKEKPKLQTEECNQHPLSNFGESR